MSAETLLRETRRRLPEFSQGEVTLAPIEKGGSDRKFYRIQLAPDRGVVLVKYARDRVENLRYVEVAQFLAAHGIRAPEIYFHDPTEGLIWMQDLGERDLWSCRAEPWTTRRLFYEAALEEIAKLHEISPKESAPQALPPPFDAALYRWEQNYFFENCLERFFAVAPAQCASLSNAPALQQIAERLAALPRVFVHRDFQSQNILLRAQRAFLIDFQGLRFGLAEYDVASLLYDPYAPLTPAERAELLRFYGARRALPRGCFEETIRLCAVQRLMQALGAYGFLGLVKGNRLFLEFIPTAMTSLGEVLRGIEGMDSLGEIVRALAANCPSVDSGATA